MTNELKPVQCGCGGTDPISREFEEIVVSYPKICTYPEYEGMPYFAIKFIENGKEIVGFGTYKPEVLSQYLKDYFLPERTAKVIELNRQSETMLTWEQLKQMEGKPVWVELYGSDYDEWVLVHAWNDDAMWFADCNGTLYTEKEHLLGRTWRAYRKERTA